jgi:putative ATPase
MRELDYGKDYRYAHDHEHGLVEQDHLPAELVGAQYYFPTNRGFEATILDRLTKWRRILKDRKVRTDGDQKK